MRPAHSIELLIVIYYLSTYFFAHRAVFLLDFQALSISLTFHYEDFHYHFHFWKSKVKDVTIMERTNIVSNNQPIKIMSIGVS